MRVIYFTLCAIINIAVLIIAIYARKFTQGSQNKFFLVIAWDAFLSAICDFICTYLQVYAGDFPHKSTILFVSTTLYFIFRNFTMVALCMYVSFLTNFIYVMQEKSLKGKFLSLLVVVPYILNVILIVANIWTGWIFTIDENSIYHRQKLLAFNYAVAFIYTVFGIAVLIAFHKTLSKSRIYAIAFMYFLSISSVLIQFFFPHLLVEMFATSIALFETMILVQRPEELTDSSTGMFNLSAFRKHGKNLFLNKNPASLIFIRITNGKTLLNALDYETYSEFLANINSFILLALKEQKAKGQLYHLQKGRFAILFKGEYTKRSSFFANHLLKTLPRTFKLKNITIETDYKICHTLYDNNSENSDFNSFKELMVLAENFDKILKSGKDVITFKDAKSKEMLKQSVSIDSILMEAIRNNLFEMYYQPIYSVSEHRIISAEALIRLKYDGKFVSPEFFIPAAERNGLIHQIGDFVLESVCQFIASDKFKETGLDYIELNLSVAQCMESGLADKIHNLTRRYGISSDKINLEITETAIDSSANTMLNNIQKLSSLGFAFSLDDYGTGYSNIKRVVTLPLKIIKFDKTFVNEVNNPQMQIVLKNNIEMMKEMKKEIVVEGIETNEMLKVFSDYHCDFIQGFYFSRPLPVNDFCSWVDNWKKQA